MHVLWFITAGLNENNRYRKINNGGNGFMPVSIEFLHNTPNGELFSVAHYYEQNGDLMRDPEVTFFRKKRIAGTYENSKDEFSFFPASFLQDNLGLYQEFFTYDEKGFIKGIYRRNQKDCAVFCTNWMKNIVYQQDLPKDLLK
jgi:hypothetical protein